MNLLKLFWFWLWRVNPSGPGLEAVASCACAEDEHKVEAYCAWGSDDPRNFDALGTCHFCERPAQGRDFCFGCHHFICDACGGQEWISVGDYKDDGGHDLEDHRWPEPARTVLA